MNKTVCLILLWVSLVIFNVANAGVLNVRKRSIEGNTPRRLNDSPGSMGVVGHFADERNEAVTRLRNILPIWWHYFLPMIQITMRDDSLRQELQKTYEHDYDSVEESNDEEMLQSNDFRLSTNDSPPVDDRAPNENSIEVPNVNAWGRSNSEFAGNDDPNETHESNIRHETTGMDNNVEQFTGATDGAFDMSVNEGIHNEVIHTFGNFQPGVSTEANEAPVDDVNVGQEIDNSETFGNAEDQSASLSNAEESNGMSTEFGTSAGNIENRLTKFAHRVEQPSQDEVDSAAMASALIGSAVNNAIWNNNLFATNLERTNSEGTFDDRIDRSHNHDEVLSISDDVSSTQDVSEHPQNMNDGTVDPNPWMFPREENVAADTDFSSSFMSTMPFFSTTPRSSESDSSS